jgi:tRNA(Ile)-lysidine synthase
MPALEQHFPGFQERFARSAQHAQSATRLLAELAEQDLAATLDGDQLDISKLRALSQDRAYNLLRHWFATRGYSMPSTAWLAEMLTQLLEAKYDAQLLVTHPDCHVRRYRDRLHLTPKLAELEGTREDQFDDKPGTGFVWNGETELAFPAYGGVLHFEPAEEGLDPDGCAATTGDRIPPRRRKTQAGAEPPDAPGQIPLPGAEHPAWERGRLPVVKNAQPLAVRGRHRHGLPLAAGAGRIACVGKLYRHRPFCRILYVDMSIRYDFMSFSTCYFALRHVELRVPFTFI